jgi:hypothetical protein
MEGKQYEILISILLFLTVTSLYSHGWDYIQPEDGGDVSLPPYITSINFILTSFILLVLFIIRIYIKKIEFEKAKLISNVMLSLCFIYILLFSKYSLIDVMIMLFTIFLLCGFILMLLFLVYLLLIFLFRINKNG